MEISIGCLYQSVVRLRAERDAYAKDFQRTQRTEPVIQPMGRVE